MGKPEVPEKPKKSYYHEDRDDDSTWFTQKAPPKPYRPPKPEKEENTAVASKGELVVHTQAGSTKVQLEQRTDSNGRKDNVQTLRKLEKALGMSLRKKRGEPKDYISEMCLDDLKKTNAGRGN